MDFRYIIHCALHCVHIYIHTCTYTIDYHKEKFPIGTTVRFLAAFCYTGNKSVKKTDRMIYFE